LGDIIIKEKVYDNEVTIKKMVMKKNMINNFSFYIHKIINIQKKTHEIKNTIY